MRVKKLLFSILLLILSLTIAACSSDTSSKEDKTSEKPSGEKEDIQGGELRVALSAQPNTLDQQIDSNIYTRDVGRLIFETLVTPDENYKPQPMLAESVNVSDDSKVYTFKLRKGILFHNGKEMKADDVVASMNRWMEKSPLAGSVFIGSTFEIKDDYNVVLTLAKPSALALDIMASPKQAAAIMPKEIIESATAKGVTEYIGTGPFKLVEWKQDQFIHFAKNKDYVPLDSKPSGLAGKKEVFVEELYLDIVTDPSTRLSGLQTEQYDIAYNIGYTDFNQVKNSSNMRPFLDAGGELTYWYNSIQGIASNPKFREAVNAALDVNEIMKAAFSEEEFFSLYSSYMNKNIKNWTSEVGSKYYNQSDPEKAKKLLKDSGYNAVIHVSEPTRLSDIWYAVFCLKKKRGGG
ncbi:ABC transporter substrate-binding protein, partial [Neobacillus niacini]|uniref:ABC transporter substrate-binding protein n=1 Tax=Neobacillus niacini TaxID=86668 RepID=UPI0030012469